MVHINTMTQGFTVAFLMTWLVLQSLPVSGFIVVDDRCMYTHISLYTAVHTKQYSERIWNMFLHHTIPSCYSVHTTFITTLIFKEQELNVYMFYKI